MFEKEAEDSFKCKKVLFKWETDKHSYINGFKDGATFGYNKAKEEMQEQGLALQSDMDKTIEQNISLKEQIEKMKAELHHRLVSPSHDDSDCLDKIVGLDRLWQFGQEF